MLSKCTKKRAVVGMSGGVDSAVAAYLLKIAGYEVIGVTLRTWTGDDGKESRCCEITDARMIADTLDIPYYVLNCQDQFRQFVTEPFIHSYLSGKTPNPCILCNRYIKWENLLDAADRFGAEYVSTGHYAGVIKLSNGRYTLQQAKHIPKDQTYMLYRLTQEQLKRTLMPLKNLTKAEVRRIAEAAGIPVADKKDSQEICFVTDGTHADFINNHITCDPPQTGSFADESGNIIGRHSGIHHYTVGQRKGLGLSLGYPAYIRQIDAINNRIIIGDEQSLYSDTVIISDLAFMGIPEIRTDEPILGKAKIRYHHAMQAAEAEFLTGNKIALHFHQPVRAAAPGQSAVLYDDNGCILCGGIIENSFERRQHSRD